MTYWSHSDPELSARSQDAMARALSGDWRSGPMLVRVAELRALEARVLSAAADLGSKPSQASTTNLTMYLVPPQVGAVYATADHERAAHALMDAWTALAPSATATPERVLTMGGTTGDDAGWTLLGVVVVGLVTAAVAFIAQQTAAVIDNQLARDAQSAQLLQQTAALTSMAEAHTEAERAAGHPIAMNDAQRAAIDALSQTSRTVAARTTAPIASSASLGLPWWLLATGAGVAVTSYFFLKGK